ncbi:hypothetical protein BDN71DRAFT_1514480 [Pleurotus eryngii]|uniref:Uncharacterized protein n=1 Tax=Pleurotus eryngii TaxID=5323 RepID=A0A9P5ZGY5_PLEER|nr:hypothetical protein BDN71DRAFT_1514480 [Pleurotus eryngii]
MITTEAKQSKTQLDAIHWISPSAYPVKSGRVDTAGAGRRGQQNQAHSLLMTTMHGGIEPASFDLLGDDEEWICSDYRGNSTSYPPSWYIKNNLVALPAAAILVTLSALIESSNAPSAAMPSIDAEHSASPSNLPPCPHTLTPVRPLQPSDVPASEPEPEVHPAISPTALSDLQTQLRKTQASLASHVDKIRHSTQSEQSDDDDDDGARSIVTVVPLELATVAKEDEEPEAEAGQGLFIPFRRVLALKSLCALLPFP